MSIGGLFHNRGSNQGRAFAAYKAKLRQWTAEETALFCDALADGASISTAAAAAGKTKGAGISKLEKIKRQLGRQAQ